MTEQIHYQISAFVDDELSAEECAFFVRRLERDPDARAKLMRFMAMGAVLRDERLPHDAGFLRSRIHDSLDGVAPARRAKPRAAWSVSSRFLKPLVSTGIAASVAVLALFAIGGGDDLGLEPGSGAPDQALQAVDSSVAPSYVVPQDPPFGGAITPPIRYTNYLMHHGEYASGLNRTLVRANVVSIREADLVVESEEAFE